MNEQLTNWLIEQTKNITNWASVEIPLFVQEYLAWNFYNGVLNASLAFLFFSACIYGIIKLKEKSDKAEFSYEDPFPFIIILLVPLVASLFLFFDEVKDVVKIKVAPKAYLMDKVLENKK